MGVISLGVDIELPIIAFLHLLIHAYFKAIIFIIVGQLIYFSLGYQFITFTGGLGVRRPIIISGFLVGGFRLIGILYIAVSYSKEPIIKILLYKKFLLVGYFIILRGVCLTYLYSLRLLFLSGIFLVHHCASLHLLERIKSIFGLTLLFFLLFLVELFFLIFYYLRFENLVNREVKIFICLFIFLSFLPFRNLIILEKNVIFS